MSTIVYTSGSFDIIHSNHIKMIEYARALGDILIVGVSTDELICTYKEPPILSYQERYSVIRALKLPDLVIPQRSLDYSYLIKNLNIDRVVIGDDWIGKYDELKKINVELFYLPYGEGISSSYIKERIRNNRTIKKLKPTHRQ